MASTVEVKDCETPTQTGDRGAEHGLCLKASVLGPGGASRIGYAMSTS